MSDRVGLAEERRRNLETELVELRCRTGQIPEGEAAEVTLSAAEQAKTRLAEAREEVRDYAGEVDGGGGDYRGRPASGNENGGAIRPAVW